MILLPVWKRYGLPRYRRLDERTRWAIAIPPRRNTELVLLPTGAGMKRVVPLPGISCDRAGWFPDGKRIVVEGQESGHSPRLWIVEVDGGPPRPVTPEGMTEPGLVSPDGLTVLVADHEGKESLFPVAAW